MHDSPPLLHELGWLDSRAYYVMAAVPKPQKAPSTAAPPVLPAVPEHATEDKASAPAEAEPAVQDSPLHVAAKAGDAEKVDPMCILLSSVTCSLHLRPSACPSRVPDICSVPGRV